MPACSILRRMGSILLVVSALVIISGCGTGSSSTPPPAITVTVSPATATVNIGKTQAFTAQVQNTSNTAVQWSVVEGNTGGTMANDGLYTAPSSAGTFHVRATSVADATKFGSATVVVVVSIPSFSSTPPTSASEGQSYNYAIAVTDSANSAITLTLTTAPAGAVLSGNTLTWTPTETQARTANSFTVTATTAAGGSAHQDWTVTPTGIIRGQRTITFVTEAGEVQQPDDTSAYTIGAWVPNGSEFTFLAGQGSSTGAFTIPGVPAGHYWLQTGPQNFIWTNRSTIDTGYDALGRPDKVLPTQSTMLQLILDGLNGWQTNDRIQLSVANTNTVGYHWTAANAGVTSIDSTFDWIAPLTDASKGDLAYIGQLVSEQVGDLSVRALRKTFGPTAFSQTDGATTTVIGTLSDVAAGSTLQTSVMGSAFAQLRSVINPKAVPYSDYFRVAVHPFGLSKGIIGATPDLLQYASNSAPLSTDTPISVAFGNPFPTTTWEPYLEYTQIVSVPYTVAGMTTSINGGVLMAGTDTTLAEVRPVITPVTQPAIEGHDLFTDNTITTLTPALMWVPPSVGSPAGYVVNIARVYANGGSLAIDWPGLLWTTQSSVVVPPGVLQAGNTYVFVIRAIFEPGVDFETAPFRNRMPFAFADVLSGVVTVSTSAGVAGEFVSASDTRSPRGGSGNAPLGASTGVTRGLPH